MSTRNYSAISLRALHTSSRFYRPLKSKPPSPHRLRYRAIIESLKYLARFNDELSKQISAGAKADSRVRRTLMSSLKGKNIINVNRELRKQIKSLLFDDAKLRSSTLAPCLRAENTKRDLIKQKNLLLKQNEELLFKFRKTFLL